MTSYTYIQSCIKFVINLVEEASMLCLYDIEILNSLFIAIERYMYYIV